MPKKRIPMPQILSSRDGTLSKDAKLVNCMVEKDGENVNVVKRPGTYLFSQFPAGLGQGMFTINGVPYAIFNDVLYLGIAPFSGIPLPVGSLPPPPAPAPLPQYAIFMGGSNALAGNPTSNTNKYSYTAATMQAGAYMVQAGFAYAACGNYSIGIWFDSPNQKYTYSGDIVSTGATSIASKYGSTAVGNSTEIIISSGTTGTSSSTIIGTIYKYQYSTDTAATTSLAIPKYAMGATGTATQGIFGCGFNLINSNFTFYATSSKYLYSNDTLSAGSNFTVAKAYIGAAGETTRGIFSGGTGTSNVLVGTVEKYTYSGDVISAGTSLSVTRTDISATGNSTIGVFAGGLSTSTVYATTDIYTYSTDAVTTGASLLTAVSSAGAVSTSPGGF